MADSRESGVKIVNLFNSSLTSSGQTLRRCYCEGHCPNGQYNGTCEIKPGGLCFTSVEAVIDDDGMEFPYRTYGCLPADERGLMQCKGHLVPHMERKSIQCCDDIDLCNRDLKPMYPERPTPDSPNYGPFDSPPTIVLLTSITICITFCLIIIAVVYLKYRKKSLYNNNNKNYLEKYQQQKNLVEIHHNGSGGGGGGGGGGGFGAAATNLIDKSSGSGSGLPTLIQRTISKQIHMIKSIGKGRYGEVWLANWRGESVAVKVFFTTEEQSWFRETEIYQTVLMRHDNILGFIAADIKGTGSWTQMLLITDYHENGSLYDYLQNHVLDQNNLLLMAISIASGLSHLHTEIFGTRGKPAIAHRDIKSKNILVKKNGECCIADFGLAIKYCSDTNEIDNPRNIKSGTKRYMAPEILNNTIQINNFDSHKMADMYSFGLVLWEMTTRCILDNLNEKLTNVNDYQMPYYDYVSSDPSFEDMLNVVCIKNIRPQISSKWDNSYLLKIIVKIMQECWHSNPAVRLTALRVKKTLSKIEHDNTCIKIV